MPLGIASERCVFTLPLLYSWDLSRVRLNRLLGFGFGRCVFGDSAGSAIELFAGNHLAGSGERDPFTNFPAHGKVCGVPALESQRGRFFQRFHWLDVPDPPTSTADYFIAGAGGSPPPGDW